MIISDVPFNEYLVGEFALVEYLLDSAHNENLTNNTFNAKNAIITYFGSS